MREDILRILASIWRRKVKSQGQSIDFDQTLTFLKSERKKLRKYYEIIFSETREKEKNCDIKYVIFKEELDLLWFIENQ